NAIARPSAAATSPGPVNALGRRVASIASIYCRAMASSEPGKVRGVDRIAARAALGRLRRNEALPWLHAEIARRLVERLAPPRARPPPLPRWRAGPRGGAARPPC